jgi:hypothetical protein
MFTSPEGRHFQGGIGWCLSSDPLVDQNTSAASKDEGGPMRVGVVNGPVAASGLVSEVPEGYHRGPASSPRPEQHRPASVTLSTRRLEPIGQTTECCR